MTERERMKVPQGSLGSRVRFVRKRLVGVSQGVLADRLGYSRAATVSDWERNETVPPREAMEDLADLAGRSFAELFGEFYTAEDSATPEEGAERAGDASETKQRAPTPHPGNDDLSRQIDEVNRLDVDEWVKAWKIGEIAAAYRSRALADNTAALRIAEEAALERARAAILNGKAMVVEGEAAAARLRGRDSGEKAYPPAQVAQVVPAPTPEERRRMEEEAKKKSA